jgi:hypothetical protein
MKKGLRIVSLISGCILLFCGCIKNRPYVTTINTAMTASVPTSSGTYNFIAQYATPAILDTQMADTSKTLVITGYGSDVVHPYDKIVLAVANYKGATGVFSIVQGQAGAEYYHNGVLSVAAGGIVSITSISSTVISGYFNFNCVDGVSVNNGKFTVGIP